MYIILHNARENHDPIYVNMDNVLYFNLVQDGTYIIFHDQPSIIVKESPKEIYQMMESKRK